MILFYLLLIEHFLELKYNFKYEYTKDNKIKLIDEDYGIYYTIEIDDEDKGIYLEKTKTY